EDAARRHHRRHAGLRIDRKIGERALLGAGEIDALQIVGGAGVLQRDMRGERAGVRGEVEREHGLDISLLLLCAGGAARPQSPTGAMRNSITSGRLRRCRERASAAPRSRLLIVIRYSNCSPPSSRRDDTLKTVKPCFSIIRRMSASAITLSRAKRKV